MKPSARLRKIRQGVGSAVPYGKVGVEQQTLCDDADAAAESPVVVAFRRKECNVLNEKRYERV